MEANRKKVSFIKHIIRLLNITPVHFIHDRVENIMKTVSWKGKFDILISRATFKLPDILLQGEFFLVPGGTIIALKGPGVEKEIKRCSEAKNRPKISQLIQYDIKTDFLEAPRKIIIGKKQNYSKKTF